MWRTGLGLAVAVVAASLAADGTSRNEVRIECHGKLRHGVVSMGAETTGTTVTFDRITWELHLPNEAFRKFAAEHHKKPIVVTGQLRRVAGVERKVRWIVDVEKLSAGTAREEAIVTAAGILRESDERGAMQLEIESGGTRWPLDLSQTKDMPERARSLTGKPIVVNGRIGRTPGALLGTPSMKIEVTQLDEARG